MRKDSLLQAKSCPFCGSRAIGFARDSYSRVFVRCFGGCGGKGGVGHDYDRAVELWNMRHEGERSVLLKAHPYD